MLLISVYAVDDNIKNNIKHNFTNKNLCKACLSYLLLCPMRLNNFTSHYYQRINFHILTGQTVKPQIILLVDYLNRLRLMEYKTFSCIPYGFFELLFSNEITAKLSITCQFSLLSI